MAKSAFSSISRLPVLLAISRYSFSCAAITELAGSQTSKAAKKNTRKLLIAFRKSINDPWNLNLAGSEMDQADNSF
jgi:hypothetical protein